MKHVNIGLGALILVSLLLAVVQPPATLTQAAAPAQSSTPEAKRPLEEAALRQAFSNAIQGREDVLAFIINRVEIQRIQFSEKGEAALLFLQMRNPNTGEVIATEPGLAIGRLNASTDGSKALDWKISLQADGDWIQQLESLPAGLLTEEGRFLYLPSTTPVTETLATPLRGYKLPWAKGLTKELSGSIGHFLIYFSCAAGETACRYAYDFADGTMFPLLASRGGIVHMYYDGCANNDHNCSNYIVLEDRSTSPWTYQLYLHIAYHSVPNNLRTLNTPVVQGQYIANVDNTGYSTGSHLHFHVHTNPNSYWGNSVDIAYDEVSFNDGEPRTCYEAEHWPGYGTGCSDTYTSQNQGANPPTGTLSQPTNSQVFTTSVIPFAGTATDDIAVTKIQPVVNYGAGWVEVGTPFFSASFNGTTDLCSTSIPDGPLQIGYYAYDYEGNRSIEVQGQRQIFKSATCTTPPPPPCVPNSSQVALFTDVDYKGTCQVFNTGSYTDWNHTMGALAQNTVDSILVGSGVTVTGYDGDYDPTYNKFAGRGETYFTSDANLDNNRLVSNKITAIRVRSKSSGPMALFVDQPEIAYAVTPTSVDSLIISAVNGNEYENADGVNTYFGTLVGPGGTIALAEQKDPIWSVGSLAAGAYTATVNAKNGASTTVASLSFSVVSGTLPAAASRSLPWQDLVESGVNDWTASGLWRQMAAQRDGSTTTAWGYNNGTDYSSAAFKGGDLTSPPITLGAGGAWLRFDTTYQTESANPYWDQRRVQISINGDSFKDVLQLSDDPMGYWLHSPAINLTGTQYRGQTVRVRFHFDTVDPYGNSGYLGWLVDNISLDTTAPDLSCADANNTPATATPIAVDGSKNGVICSGGDVDYYSFSATAGMRLAVSVDAAVLGSPLDSVLRLYDPDGKNVLVQNDDATPDTQDSLLTYTVQRTGVYYLRVSAWDHPSGGSPLHTYTLKLNQVVGQPTVTLLYPSTAYVPGAVFPVIANVTGAGVSGPARVDVYYHSTNWNDLWEKIASDNAPADGFYIPLDLSTKAPVSGTLLVQAFDQFGSSAITLLSPLTVDSAAPSASFTPLATSESSWFPVNWTLSDDLSGLAGFTIQVQIDGGAWADWLTSPSLDLRQAWYQGELGHTYGFRLQATDLAGNIRAFPASAEVTTTVPPCSPDAFEDADDTAGTAPSLTAGTPQQHNFCAANDADWLKVQATDGHPLLISAKPGTGMGAFSLGLYDSTGQTLLLETTSSGAGFAAALPIIPPPGGGTFLVRIRPLDSRLAGNTVSYTLQCGPANVIYFPLVGR